MENDAERAARHQKAWAEAKADAEGQARSAVAAPGWYPHPSMAETRQYWDGEKWTEHVAPMEGTSAVPPPAAVTPIKDETSYAWTIALLPALWLPFAYFAPGWEQTNYALLGFVLVTLMLAYFDGKRLRERGVDLDSSWAFILIPVYLMNRTKHAGSTPAIPIAWFVTFGISILASFTFAASIQFDGDVESRNIEGQLDDQGYPGIDVTCPSKTGHTGDTVLCTVVDQQGNSGVLTVTLDSDTGYVWRMG